MLRLTARAPAAMPRQHSVRPLNRIALLETALLGALAALLLLDAQRGVLSYYINPRYTGLVLVGAVALLVLGGGETVRPGEQIGHAKKLEGAPAEGEVVRPLRAGGHRLTCRYLHL